MAALDEFFQNLQSITLASDRNYIRLFIRQLRVEEAILSAFLKRLEKTKKCVLLWAS